VVYNSGIFQGPQAHSAWPFLHGSVLCVVRSGYGFGLRWEETPSSARQSIGPATRTARILALCASLIGFNPRRFNVKWDELTRDGSHLTVYA